MNLFDLLRTGFSTLPKCGVKSELLTRRFRASELPKTLKLLLEESLGSDTTVEVEVTIELQVFLRFPELGITAISFAPNSNAAHYLMQDLTELRRAIDKEESKVPRKRIVGPRKPIEPMVTVQRVVPARSAEPPKITRTPGVGGVWQGL